MAICAQLEITLVGVGIVLPSSSSFHEERPRGLNNNLPQYMRMHVTYSDSAPLLYGHAIIFTAWTRRLDEAAPVAEVSHTSGRQWRKFGISRPESRIFCLACSCCFCFRIKCCQRWGHGCTLLLLVWFRTDTSIFFASYTVKWYLALGQFFSGSLQNTPGIYQNRRFILNCPPFESRCVLFQAAKISCWRFPELDDWYC